MMQVLHLLRHLGGASVYKAKLVKADSVAAAAKEIAAIDVSEECVQIMKNKAVFRLVKLHGVRAAPASIIKQEMLAVGADAAVSQWTVSCEKPRTDVLLMGTLKHYRALVAKMRQQGARLPGGKKEEYKAIAEEISAALKADLG